MIFLAIYLIGALAFYIFCPVTTTNNPKYHREVGYALLWPLMLIYVIGQFRSGNAKWQ